MNSGNWIIDNIMNALSVWNAKLQEIWLLITQSPESFKGGGIWNMVVSINGALKAIFSLLAIGIAVAIYFGLRGYLGTETISWLCILGAAPFTALGFLRYNGMPAEKFIAAFIRSEFLIPKRLLFHPTDIYYEILQPTIRKYEKEAQKKHD